MRPPNIDKVRIKHSFNKSHNDANSSNPSLSTVAGNVSQAFLQSFMSLSNETFGQINDPELLQEAPGGEDLGGDEDDEPGGEKPGEIDGNLQNDQQDDLWVM